MSARTCRKWVLKTPFDGYPKREDFEIIEETLPPLQDGEILVEAQYISVDPYLRAYGIKEPGKSVSSFHVGKVTETKNGDFAVGDFVWGYFGWVTRCICNPKEPIQSIPTVKLDPSIHKSPSTGIGILGMPGATSYFGLLEICHPKEGETLVVNAAAGAVGSAVGQIGKIKGMRVVGFAGSDEKVEYLKSIGFDAAYNYKTVSSLSDALAESCPNGVDVFFDNVGGEFLEAVLLKMNTFGRVSVCGCISQYNSKDPPVPLKRSLSSLVLWSQLTIQGFIVTRWFPKWNDAFKEMAQWISEGKLQYRETVYDGFDNLFDAFAALFEGTNIGKIVVKV